MKANENKILTIAGKKVVVRYARTQEDACASCAFCSRKECHDLDCNMRDIVGESVCKYAYFVAAEDGEADTTAKARPVPADVQEAARAYSASVSNGHHFRDLETGYAAGMLAERERLMKDAPVADVIEMRGSTGPFADYPFMLSLGFRKIPNIEHHGGKVRVIIEEIK